MKSVKVRQAVRPAAAELRFPGDKSLSHRAIIFGSLAEGTSVFTNVLNGEDCACTRKAFEAMGVRIKSSDDGTELHIEGKGLRLRQPSAGLYLGNSGTSMRLLMGVLAGQSFRSTLTGDPSLSSRPMRRVADPLRAMGAKIEGKDNGNFAPIHIVGSPLKGRDHVLDVASAQVKSALLLAGLYADGTTSVTEPVKSRDHTENFLKHFGVKVGETGLTVSVRGGESLQAKSFEVPGDISSAAFFMAIAALLPKTKIRFRSVLWNPTRTGIVEVLERMGVEIRKEAVHRRDGPEPTADFSVNAGELKPFEIRKEALPSLIDEIPVLTVLATQANGTSIIHEASELRVKEADRIHSMVTGLSKMGAKIRAEKDTLIIDGPAPLKGAAVDSFKDHRTAMALVVAGLAAAGETAVRDVECIGTSFPNFFELLSELGAHCVS